MNASEPIKARTPAGFINKAWEARRAAMLKLPVSEEINDNAYRSAAMPCAPFEKPSPTKH